MDEDEEFIDEFDNINARIPKDFNPEKYNITFYFDVINLKYTINGEISLISLKNNPKYLIINALPSEYEIKLMTILKFDIIMDDWIILSNKYLNSLPNQRDNIEECIYFPLENVNIDDKIKITFTIEGKIEMLKQTGLSVNFNDPEIQCLKINKLKELWEKEVKNCQKENLKNNRFLSSLVLSVVSEPNYIRLIFPCFDEPCYKSIFSFNLILDKFYMDNYQKLKCITNGTLYDVKSIENETKYLFSYRDTPLMSIYLFTFVIGNYDMIETINDNNIKIRVFTPLKNHHDGALAMNMMQYGIKFYHNFFNITYYYDKIDLVPIPEMAFRAVENLGCIVFINYALLYGHFQSIFEKKLISRTCCHELSHMWFGNLVTMEWWDDIWLNEGFARIFEYLCLNSFEDKKMKYWDNFMELIYESAITADERISTHPIKVSVPSAREIDNIFDVISYAKGASVIRMLYYYLGEDLFRESIRKYMLDNKFKNTTTEILWKCFNDVTGKDILTLMNEWVNFPSHPILYVEFNKTNVVIKQKAFNERDSLWKIPLFVKCKNFEKIFLMESNEFCIKLNDLNIKFEDIENGNDYIIVNSDLKGFYRVKYCDIIENNIISLYVKQNENVNFKISEFDIFGILSMKFMLEEWDNLIKILQNLKPIKSYLLLKYTIGIYHKIISTKCKFVGYESILNEEDRIKEENNIKMINEIFSNIIDNDPNFIKSIVDKFYINEQNKEVYYDLFNDEYESVFLYFLCLIGKKEEVIKKMFISNLNDFEFINKNLKLTMIAAIMENLNLLPSEEQVEYFKIILNDYISNYYVNSTLIKRDNLNAMLNFNNCCSEVILYFVDVIFDKFDDSRYNFTYSQIFKKNKTKINFFQSLLNWLYNQYLKDIKEQNLEITFSTFINQNKSNNFIINRFFFLKKIILYTGNNDTIKKLLIENSLSHISNISEEDKNEIRKLFI